MDDGMGNAFDAFRDALGDLGRCRCDDCEQAIKNAWVIATGRPVPE